MAAAITAAEKAARDKLLDVQTRFLRRAPELVYGQARPMPPSRSLFAPLSEVQRRIDCSTHATFSYRDAGHPDPNGRGYDGYGFTGTLIAQGEQTRVPRVGDLAFYGNPNGRTGHVAVYIGGNQVCTFGSTPIKVAGVHYRGDFDQFRSYPLTLAQPDLYYLEELPARLGGAGPDVLGPWKSQADRDANLKKLRDNGWAAAPMSAYGKWFIYRYATGTYGLTLRYGGWAEKAARDGARAALQRRLGRVLRPYRGKQNSAYPV